MLVDKSVVGVEIDRHAGERRGRWGEKPKEIDHSSEEYRKGKPEEERLQETAGCEKNSKSSLRKGGSMYR